MRSLVALAALVMVPRARAQLAPAGASAAVEPGACDITFADIFSKVSELDAACPDECTVECRAAALPFLDSCGALLDVLSIFGDDDNSTRAFHRLRDSCHPTPSAEETEAMLALLPVVVQAPQARLLEEPFSPIGPARRLQSDICADLDGNDTVNVEGASLQALSLRNAIWW